MRLKPASTLAALLGVLACISVAAAADRHAILLQSTTSTANSGLYDYLLPLFTEQSGIDVHVVAVGTGQAIRNAGNCDGDVLLVHAKQAEDEFVADGFGVERFNVMYNDFVFVGPDTDPAQLRDSDSATQALTAIASSQAIFASRGDNSGTHKKELQLWQATGQVPVAATDRWYRETGSGMGATLNIAIGMQAYTLTDRATWLNFGNRQRHTIVYQGDAGLFNQYGVIRVNPDHCPNVDADNSQIFIDWLTGEAGQAAIAAYRVGDQQLFFPNADR
jgi:tungstate transport system substrate-binding protein